MKRFIFGGLLIALAALLAGCGAGEGGMELPDTPSTEVTKLVAVYDHTGIQLAWLESEDEYAYGNVVYVSTDGGTTYDSGTKVGKDLAYTFNDAATFTFGKNYMFKVTTYNDVDAESNGLETPAEVSDIKVEVSGADATVSWTASSGASSYTVYVGDYSSADGTVTWDDDDGHDAGSVTSITLEGIVMGGEYVYKVVAVGSSAGSPGAITPLDIPAGELYRTPGNEEADDPADVPTKVWWAGVTVTDVQGYSVYLKETTGTYDSGESVTTVPTEAEPYKIEDLANGTSYTVRVATVDSEGNESAGRTTMFTPTSASDDIAPRDAEGPPDPLRAVPLDRQVLLDWDAASPSVVSYNIYVSTDPLVLPTDGNRLAPPSPLVRATQNYTVDVLPNGSDLINGTTYSFRVTALDDRGNESEGITQIAVPGALDIQVYADPIGGVYNWGGKPTAERTVTITGNDMAGTIHYTLDKTNPTPDGTNAATLSWDLTNGALTVPTLPEISENITITALLVDSSGDTGVTFTNKYRIYTANDNTFKQFGGMIYQRRYCTAHLRVDGTVIFIGGKDPSGGDYVTEAEYYDNKDEYFLEVGNLLSVAGAIKCRDHASDTLLDDATVFVCGGRSDMGSGNALRMAYINPEIRGTATPGTDGDQIFDSVVSNGFLGGWADKQVNEGDYVTITSGKACGERAKIKAIVGGVGGYLETELFGTPPEPGDDYVIGGNFKRVEENMRSSRFYHTATRLYSGKVFIAGGIGGSFIAGGSIYNGITDDNGTDSIGDNEGWQWPGAGVSVGDIVELTSGDNKGASGPITAIILSTDPPKLTVAGLGEVLTLTFYEISSGYTDTCEIYNPPAYLTADALAGAASVVVDDPSKFRKFQAIVIGKGVPDVPPGVTTEFHIIESIAGNTLNLLAGTSLGVGFTVAEGAYAVPRGVGSVAPKGGTVGSLSIEVDFVLHFRNSESDYAVPLPGVAVPNNVIIVGDNGTGTIVRETRVIETEDYTAAGDDGVDILRRTLTFDDGPLGSDYEPGAYVTQIEGGIFTSTGALNHERFGHTATLLEDGRVFIAGGLYDYWNSLCDWEYTTEIYNPKSGTCEFAGYGNSAYLDATRYYHAATRLMDGRVLITGGFESPAGSEFFGGLYVSDPQSSAEIFDPKTETIFPAGAMTSARALHTSTLLSDGRVLISGGITKVVGNYYPVWIDTAEVYDPATGNFTAVKMLLEPRFAHSAVLLENGKVLIGGGRNSNLPELFLPSQDRFVATASCMSGDRYIGCTATLLDDGDDTTTEIWEGMVLVAGGQRKHHPDCATGRMTEGHYLATAETYDSPTIEFTYTGSSMADKRRDHTATRLDDGHGAAHPSWEGKVLIAGGYNTEDGGLIGAELYDPELDFDYSTTTSPFMSVRSMSVARYGHTATLLTDGTVLMAGGGPRSASLNTAELYDPTTQKFSMVNDMNFGRYHHAAIRLSNGKVLITGGRDPFDRTAEIYDPDPAMQSFTLLSERMNYGRDGHEMVLLTEVDGTTRKKVLIVGGEVADIHAEIYDPDLGAEGQFVDIRTKAGEVMWIGHYGHTLTALVDRRVLVSAGDAVGVGECFTYTGNIVTSYFGPAAGFDPDNKIPLDGSQPWQYHAGVLLPSSVVDVGVDPNMNTRMNTPLLLWEHVGQVFFPD